MKRYLLLALFLFIQLPSYACSCSETPSVKEEAAQTPVILAGKIISMEIVVVEKRKMIRYNLVVSKVYKGKVSTGTVAIVSAESGSLCGFMFQIGKEYIVYSYPKPQAGKDVLSTDNCTPTRLADAEEAVQLQKIFSPQKKTATH